MPGLKDMARGLYEGSAAGADLDATIERYIADDFVEHEEMPPGMEGSGKEAGRQLFAMMHAAFPDFRIEVLDLVEEGDKVAAMVEFTGTHEGEFMGIPPSGNKMRMKVFDLLQFRDGKAIAHWGLTDTAAMMAQLGAPPAP